MGPVGISTGGAESTSSAGAPIARAAPSPIPLDSRTTLARVGPGHFIAQGHAGGRFDAEVYVTPSAKDAVFSPVSKIAPGTALVMYESPRGKAENGPTLMMEKREPGFDPAHGDWRYVVADGQSVQDGALSLCARCHDEAPHDHVFALADE